MVMLIDDFTCILIKRLQFLRFWLTIHIYIDIIYIDTNLWLV